MHDEMDVRFSAWKYNRTADLNPEVTYSDAIKRLSVVYNAGRRTKRCKMHIYHKLARNFESMTHYDWITKQ